MNASKINFHEAFIKPLSKEGIIEIVNGLQSTPALRNKYQLSIEEGLDIEMANYLIAGSNNNAIAPILQILLTEIWKKEKKNIPKIFSIKNYRTLKKDGYYLDYF